MQFGRRPSLSVNARGKNLNYHLSLMLRFIYSYNKWCYYRSSEFSHAIYINVTYLKSHKIRNFQFYSSTIRSNSTPFIFKTSPRKFKILSQGYSDSFLIYKRHLILNFHHVHVESKFPFHAKASTRYINSISIKRRDSLKTHFWPPPPNLVPLLSSMKGRVSNLNYSAPKKVLSSSEKFVQSRYLSWESFNASAAFDLKASSTSIHLKTEFLFVTVLSKGAFLQRDKKV